MTILREQDLDCQSHGCKFARVKTGMRNNGRCTCVDKLISEIAAQQATIDRLEAEHKDLVLRNKLLRDRPDLPIERISAYDGIMTKIEQQAKEITDLECKLGRSCDESKMLQSQWHESKNIVRAQDIKIKVLREALQFYAAPQTYGMSGGSNERILSDGGKKAQAALHQQQAEVPDDK